MTNRAYATHWYRHPAVPSGDQLTFGERAADAMRRGMGSWPFVFGFFAFMIGWAAVNTLVLSRWLSGSEFDAFPYILLNLFLSMLAGVQAAALLIAASALTPSAARSRCTTMTPTKQQRRSSTTRP